MCLCLHSLSKWFNGNLLYVRQSLPKIWCPNCPTVFLMTAQSLPGYFLNARVSSIKKIVDYSFEWFVLYVMFSKIFFLFPISVFQGCMLCLSWEFDFFLCLDEPVILFWLRYLLLVIVHECFLLIHPSINPSFHPSIHWIHPSVQLLNPSIHHSILSTHDVMCKLPCIFFTFIHFSSSSHWFSHPCVFFIFISSF